jgi:prepilin-type N-terminal cleavage/methylation domain-containing protein
MKKGKKGFTLIELVLIIVIIGIIATVAVRSLQPAMNSARQEATINEMEQLATAIIGDRNQVQGGMRSDFGYVGDIGALPPNLEALASNPGGFSTWNGPYIVGSYLEDPDDYKEDAWNKPYSYSGGLTITSTGGGAPLTRSLAPSLSDLTANALLGRITDGLGAPPGGDALRVNIVIYFPDGKGGMTSATTIPSDDGVFSFTDMIPIGNHLIRAIYSAGDDTTASYVSVVPGSTQHCELRFSGSLW